MQAAARTTGVFVYGVVPSGADLPPGLAEAVHERIRLRLVGPVAAYDFVEEA